LWAAIAPIGQFYLAWVGLVPLFWRLQSTIHTRRAAALGFVSGAFFFALGFHWLFHATWPGYLVVCMILSLYWMLAAIVIHRVRGLGALSFILVAAATWAATEYLRGTVLGGFPWLNLGETQAPFMLLFCQIADVTGVAGVTAWAVLINATLFRLILDWRNSIHAATLSFVLTLLLAGYGWMRMRPVEDSSPSLRIALVQSNHVHTPDGTKTVTQQQQIDYLLERSKAIENVDLIAWPETTMPPLNVEARTEPGLGGAALFNRTLEQVGLLARDRNASIVTGGYFVGGFRGEVGKRKATDIRNSVYVISRDGQLAGRYDKIRLVPFAEYIPFQESQNVFHRVMTSFATRSYAAGYRLTPADERTVFEFPSPGYRARVIAPICFEDTIAPLIRRFFKPEGGASHKRADLILNISNDGWFNSFEKAQHLQIAVFRSIENRVPTARVSNTGQSAFIDSDGRITASLPAFEEGILLGTCRLDPRISFYTRFGDVFAWLCIGVSLAGVVCSLRPATDYR
jgi:apolipoprotein N-acyltransferase